MANAPHARQSLEELLGEPAILRWTTRYLKRLLIERPSIRARLLNPGGSIILMGTDAVENSSEYSAVIGNDVHLDLIEAEMTIQEFPAPDQIALMAWVDGLSPEQRAQFEGVRGRVKPRSEQRRAERKAHDVVESLNGTES